MRGDYKRCSLPEAGFFVTVHNPSRMMFLFLLFFFLFFRADLVTGIPRGRNPLAI